MIQHHIRYFLHTNIQWFLIIKWSLLKIYYIILNNLKVSLSDSLLLIFNVVLNLDLKDKLFHQRILHCIIPINFIMG